MGTSQDLPGHHRTGCFSFHGEFQNPARPQQGAFQSMKSILVACEAEPD
jgi:hypothetical protein